MEYPQHLTDGQRTALVGLLLEYITASTKADSQLSQSFEVVGTQPGAQESYTPWQLLEVVQNLPISNPPTYPPKEG